MSLTPGSVHIGIMLAVLVVPLSGFSQNVEKVVYDPSDSANRYYLAIRPRSNNIKGTLLLITSFVSPEDLLPETRLHNVAYANDLLTVYVSMGKKLSADTAAINRINDVVRNIQATYSVDTARFALAGYSYAGAIALRYAEMAREDHSLAGLRPKAVFAVDAPVDLIGLWRWSEREIKKNYFPGSVADGKILLDLMTKDIGPFPANTSTYRYLSPFIKDDSTIGNERYLLNVAVRLYYDADIEWQLASRRNSLYDTNIPDGTELISRLLLLGNDRAEFIRSKKPGVRSNGIRNPNSLSIVDEVNCIQWIKKELAIFDPDTWVPPYRLSAPVGWDVERFALPPDFAPQITWKGVEDIRFHPGWGKATSEGYWSYVYLWWLDSVATLDASTLQQALQAYYTGLVQRNIAPRKIAAGKIIPTLVDIKKTKPKENDKETYIGTIRMLDYMAQNPMELKTVVHVKESHSFGKKIVMVEISPQPFGHPLWKELDKISEDFVE